MVAETAEGKGRIEVMSWLSRMTLDVIGLAGFNYEFNALSSEPKSNELNNAFSAIFRAGTSKGIIPVLRNLIPALRWLVGALCLVLFNIDLTDAIYSRSPLKEIPKPEKLGQL